MNKFQVGWYLIYTRPRHEKKIHARLTEIEMKSFLPTKKSIRTWHDRRKIIDEPLFPSYVFVYLNNMRNYYDGINTEGALFYVKTGKEAARVCETVVNNIKLVTEQEGELEISHNYFQPGRRLVINHGALTGLSCEVVQYNGRRKLLVRVELLMRNVLLTLPEEHLIAV